MPDSAQRTEKPTPRRLDRAYKEGQFPISKDLISAVTLIGYAAALAWMGPQWLESLRSLLRGLLRAAFVTELSPLVCAQLFLRAVQEGSLSFFLCGLGVVILGVAIQLSSTQMRLPGRIRIDISRLSPMRKLKGMMGQNLASLGYAIVLLSLVGWLLWIEMDERLPQFLALVHQPVERIGAGIQSTVMTLVWRIAAVTVLVGVIDAVLQRIRFLKNLRMTKHEVRQEAKEQDGNPQIKMKIRRLQRDAARKRMMQAVPTATAVIVNPTHFAVAIRYQMDSNGAPKVVAKGKDFLALRIRQLAIRNQVPIVENPPLAQTLYKAVEVGQEIPGHLYRAVAEILAYIHRLTGGVLPG